VVFKLTILTKTLSVSIVSTEPIGILKKEADSVGWLEVLEKAEKKKKEQKPIRLHPLKRTLQRRFPKKR
jgi:hypothetical protein